MASKRNVTWKCPFCDKRFDREKLVIHVDDKHQEEIPEGFTALRYVFHYVNKRPLDYHGRCTECKGPTPWDEEVGRYKRQCGRKECHDSYVKRFEENMIKKKGYTRETSTQEGLERMLKNRKISGQYTFQNGKKRDYVGSYEKKCLEFMDKVMNIDPDDILSPGPVLEYKFDGKTHYYISDFYYQPYNLVIEVKDGGDNPNTRNMEEYRRKQIAKEEYIIKHTNYNYIRLTNNDFGQLMSVFADLKMQLVDNSKDRVIHVNEETVFNEFMNALTSGYFPGYEDCDAYICTADYMQNNVFADCGQNFFAIASDPGLHNLIYVNNEGVLTSSSLEEFDKTYPGVIDHVNIFALKVPMSGIHNALANYIGKVLDREGMYYSVFKEHLYSIDQVKFSDKVLGEVNNEISDFNTIYGMTKGTLVYNESDMISKGNNTYYNYRDGKTYMRSEINPDFFVETTSPKNKVFMEQILLGGMVNNG